MHVQHIGEPHRPEFDIAQIPLHAQPVQQTRQGLGGDDILHDVPGDLDLLTELLLQ